MQSFYDIDKLHCDIAFLPWEGFNESNVPKHLEIKTLSSPYLVHKYDVILFLKLHFTFVCFSTVKDIESCHTREVNMNR